MTRAPSAAALRWWGGWLFATTGLGHALALDAETGAMQWRQATGVPVRAAPVVSGGRGLRRQP